MPKIRSPSPMYIVYAYYLLETHTHATHRVSIHTQHYDGNEEDEFYLERQPKTLRRNA